MLQMRIPIYDNKVSVIMAMVISTSYLSGDSELKQTPTAICVNKDRCITIAKQAYIILCDTLTPSARVCNQPHAYALLKIFPTIR